MDTDKLLLEIHGDMKGMSRDVAHVREKYDTLDARVVALHRRVDTQDKRIFKGIGIMTGVGLVLGWCSNWLKVKLGF